MTFFDNLQLSVCDFTSQVILCNDTLLEILHRSGLHLTLEEALSLRSSSSRIPITSLSPEQRFVWTLNHLHPERSQKTIKFKHKFQF